MVAQKAKRGFNSYMDSTDESLRKMHEVLIDSAMADTISLATELNTHLLSEIAPLEKLEEYIKYLNEKWQADGYQYEHIALSGSLYLCDEGTSREEVSNDMPEESMRVDRLNKVEVITTGFKAISSEEIIGSQKYSVQRIYLKGFVEPNNFIVFDDIDQDETNDDYHDCLIPLDGHSYVEYNKMTHNKAKAWLELYSPSLKTELDLLSTFEDTAERIMCLKHFGNIPYEPTVDDYDVQMEVIKAYIEYLSDFDFQLPYLFEITGRIEPIGAKVDNVFVRSDGPEAFMMTDFIVKRDDEKGAFILSLRGDLIPRRRSSSNPIVLPIQSIRSAVSVRKTLFGD